jgi:hypothetical protein
MKCKAIKLQWQGWAWGQMFKMNQWDPDCWGRGGAGGPSSPAPFWLQKPLRGTQMLSLIIGLSISMAFCFVLFFMALGFGLACYHVSFSYFSSRLLSFCPTHTGPKFSTYAFCAAGDDRSDLSHPTFLLRWGLANSENIHTFPFIQLSVEWCKLSLGSFLQSVYCVGTLWSSF